MSDPYFQPKVENYSYSTTNRDSIVPDGYTKSLGLFQSDIIIRTGIVAALQEMRAHRWLLDYIFAQLPQDGLTYKQYGIAEAEKFKKWFLETEINVRMNYDLLQNPKFPCISIALVESTEDKSPLGDKNYDIIEKLSSSTLIATIGPLAAVSYDTNTGKLVIPNDNNVDIYAGMLVLDGNTRMTYPILELDSNTDLYITTGIQSTLSNLFIVPADQYYAVTLERTQARETYRLGCHAQGHSIELTYLYYVLLFIIHWGKQKYFEARGFELSKYSSTDFIPEAEFANEIVFSRYTTFSGLVNHFWPKSASLTIQGVNGGLFKVLDGGQSPNSIDTSNQMWSMELDDQPF